MTFLCFQKVVPPIVNTQHRNARCRLYLLYLFKMYNVHTVLFRDSLVKVTQIQHVLIRAPLQVNTIIVQCTVITTSFVSVKSFECIQQNKGDVPRSLRFPNTSRVLVEYGHSLIINLSTVSGSENPSLWTGKD